MVSLNPRDVQLFAVNEHCASLIQSISKGGRYGMATRGLNGQPYIAEVYQSIQQLKASLAQLEPTLLKEMSKL